MEGNAKFPLEAIENVYVIVSYLISQILFIWGLGLPVWSLIHKNYKTP